ncbi:MAG: zinc ABC transporter substrate-binding protein [Lachnospiraceae bacterium]|nr:zinc ABC transporter substrate-binding protein [Lachnospiraceae bacterium]
MKRVLPLLMTVVLAFAGLAGCSADKAQASNTEGASETTENTSEQINIVTTIFPTYDWVNVILGDKKADANVTMLLDNGVDLHSYQPTAEDISKIASCDMFIYVGGESDEWVEDVLAQATNKDMKVINLLEVLGDSVKAEEIVEGMQGEDEHEDGEDEGHDHDHEDEEEEEFDEHVWLSLRNAQILCAAIAEALEAIDADNASAYQANLEGYEKELQTLDAEYKAMVADASKDTVLFADRFPFRYLVDDYDLTYYAAFVGCSAESEASFETVVFLAEKVDELNLPAILIIDNSDGKIAETVRDNTAAKDAQILTIDSLQSTTSAQYASGRTYLSAMKENLDNLKIALN